MKRKLQKITALLIFIIVILTNIISIGAEAKFTHFPPKGLGAVHTYTVWDKMKWGYGCRDLINFTKSHNALSDTYGIVKYGEYWAGATTTTIGNVGDILLVVQEEGIIYPVIIADTKNQKKQRV